MSYSSLTDAMFSTGELARVFSGAVTVQRMLDVEAALAAAQARCGVIPQNAVAPIQRVCKAERIDIAALVAAAGGAGNLAIPLVKQLTALVAKDDAEAAKYVHWGATSQDVIDTGMVLQLRDALALIETDLARLAQALATLARTHRSTPVMGRTWMQHALPVTFGLKAAGWLDALMRHQDRLAAARGQALVLQFGGAAGTLASLGTRGLEVGAALAQELDLSLPELPWHAARDRVVDVAVVLGMLTGTLGKIARDLALHMQTEIAELAEPQGEGRGGSSAMPHKRNPVGCAAVLAASVRMPGLVSTMLAGMVQEQERALGGWQAEWDTLPQIVQLAGGALRQLGFVAEGLSVDAQRMRANMDLTHGLVMAEAVTLALGANIGRLEAHKLVEGACRAAVKNGTHLREALAAEPRIARELPAGRIDELLDPAQYLGESETFVDRVLQAWQKRA